MFTKEFRDLKYELLEALELNETVTKNRKIPYKERMVDHSFDPRMAKRLKFKLKEKELAAQDSLVGEPDTGLPKLQIKKAKNKNLFGVIFPDHRVGIDDDPARIMYHKKNNDQVMFSSNVSDYGVDNLLGPDMLQLSWPQSKTIQPKTIIINRTPKGLTFNHFVNGKKIAEGPITADSAKQIIEKHAKEAHGKQASGNYPLKSSLFDLPGIKSEDWSLPHTHPLADLGLDLK